jgi:MFS superfamily sulfate permease-like transporter
MSFTESIASARAFAGPGESRPTPDRELLALGVANFAGGLLGAMPAGGGATQTAVNHNAGAKTRVAGLVTAAAALAALLVLAPLIAPMPQVTLAAIVMAYSLELIKPAEFRAILRIRRAEFQWALIAFAGVILLGTLKGILVAIVMSLLSLAHQAANPPVYALGRKRNTNVFRPLSEKHSDDETFPGLLLLRVEGRVFFANAQSVGDKIMPLIEQYQPRVIALDCSALLDIEYTALKMLTEAEARLRDQGVILWLVAMNTEVLRVVRSSPLGETLGKERMLFKREEAVERYLANAGDR